MRTLALSELEAFDGWLASHLKNTDKVSRETMAAIVMAAGGKVELTADQIANLLDGNVRLRHERTPLGYIIIASSRPRCEKCGRWEDHE